METNRDFSRQSFLGGDSERLLAGAHVAVVGCGGGGSHIAQQLAHLGVGTISLFDPQEIEASNLNRLVTAKCSDVDRATKKVQILERYILETRPETSVYAFPSKWQDCLSELKKADFLFGCVDGFIERNYLESFCRRYLIYYIDIGMDVIEYQSDRFVVSGQVVVSKPGYPCMQCVGFLTPEKLALEENQYGHAGGNPQVVWTNGTLASVAVGEFVKILTPWDRFNDGYVWLELDGNSQVIQHSRQPKFAAIPEVCPHHGGEEGVGDFAT